MIKSVDRHAIVCGRYRACCLRASVFDLPARLEAVYALIQEGMGGALIRLHWIVWNVDMGIENCFYVTTISRSPHGTIVYASNPHDLLNSMSAVFTPSDDEFDHFKVVRSYLASLQGANNEQE